MFGFISISEAPVSAIRADQKLIPALYVEVDAFFGPVFAGSVVLQPPLFVADDNIAPPGILLTSQFIAPVLVLDPAETIHSAGVAMGGSLLPIPWVETDVFFVPHMVVGAVSLQPAALQDGDAVHLAGIGSSSKLASSLLVDSDSIHAAIAAVGAATIAPVVFSDTDLLYVSALVPGGVGLSAGHVDDSESFMVSTVAPQAAFLQPHAYQDVGDIPAPGLIQGIGLDTLRPAWLFDIDKISRPTVTGGKKPVSKPPLYGSVSDQNLRGSCKSPAYMIGSVIPNALLGSGKSPAYMIGSAGSPKLKGSTRDAA